MIDVLATYIGTALPSLPDLEAQWSTRPAAQRIPEWEQLHVPLMVRVHVNNVEMRLSCSGGTLNACITGKVDY